jgi:hypothetical protein
MHKGAAKMATTYEIRFGEDDGTLACLLVIARASDEAAVKLAHSVKSSNYAQVEIWKGEDCVHEALLGQTSKAA